MLYSFNWSKWFFKWTGTRKQFKKNNKSKKEQQAYYNNLITEAQQKALLILDELGLSDKIDKYPYQLSGGEQQRVAIARAIINEPAILLADEPTGNLDPANSWEIMKLLDEANKRGTTVIVVTHNLEIVNAMKKRVITMKKGNIVSDTKRMGV